MCVSYRSVHISSHFKVDYNAKDRLNSELPPRLQTSKIHHTYTYIFECKIMYMYTVSFSLCTMSVLSGRSVCVWERVFPSLSVCVVLPIYLHTAKDATILVGVNSFLFIRLPLLLVHNYTKQTTIASSRYLIQSHTHSHKYDPNNFSLTFSRFFRLTPFFRFRNPNGKFYSVFTLFIEF